MRKIILGKSYDTTTANLIKEIDNLGDKNRCEFKSQFLYKKKTGEFFLYFTGGFSRNLADLAYFHPDNPWKDDDIFPLKEKEAKSWVEDNANEIYEELFGECEE